MVTLKKDKSLTLLQKFIKRLFDIFFSLICLLMLSPLIAIVWVTVTVSLNENGFFFQSRVGRNGKLFNVVKIKTMRNVSSNQSSITAYNDPRITRLGGFLRKTKVDELPQLWNVLVGQMSIVGPRPDVPSYTDNLHGRDRLILSVKPGITGLAQVSGYRGEVETDSDIINRVKCDIFYLENWSIILDLKIVFKTVYNAIKGEEKAY